MSRQWSVRGALAAGIAASVGASACCAGPLVLVLLGVSGAWGSRLVALQRFQPVFIAAAVLAFGFAFYRLYRSPEACSPAEACALPTVRRRQRVLFWTLGLAAAALVSFPLYASLFY